MNISSKSPTMGEFSKHYLETMEYILSPTTLQFYRRNITEYILPLFGEMALEDITTNKVQEYITYLLRKRPKTRGVEQNQSNMSPSTVRRYLTVLKSILKQAVKQGIIEINPASSERLTLPKQPKPKIDIFTRQEAAELLAALESEPLQFQALIQLAIYTGARRGELVGLRFSDFDYDNHKLTIERAAYKLKGEPPATKPPKDYESRTISINPTCTNLVQLLQQEKRQIKQDIGSKWAGSDWLFTKWNGELMNPHTPTAQFAKFLKKNNLKHRKFHALRHTSATLLLYSGINIKQVQSRLGHNDIETTNKYLHYIEEADEQASKALTQLLEQNVQKIKSEKGAV